MRTCIISYVPKLHSPEIDNAEENTYKSSKTKILQHKIKTFTVWIKTATKKQLGSSLKLRICAPVTLF